MMSITIFALLCCMVDKTWAFSTSQSISRSAKSTTQQYMFFADTPTTSEDEIQSNVQVQIMSGSDESMIKAAQFMVESFWLGSPQQLLIDTSDDVSESSKSSLISIQADDLTEKYGDRMGSRKLDALVLAATEEGDDTGDIIGLTTLEVRLLENQKDILSAEQSEFKLTQAVALLGPKQRREYKDASVFDIANQLLSPDIIAILSLSNLCVSDKHRRKGVAAALCKEAERVAKQELGFDEMYLRVEVENDAAKRLYENKLGYENVFEAPATVLRVDGKRGGFVELENTDIAVLKKKI